MADCLPATDPGSTTRKQRSLRSRTLDEDKNGAAMDDDEIEEVQVVEDVAAPRGRVRCLLAVMETLIDFPVLQIRPPAKSTYSKRRGGGKEVKD